MTVRVVVADAKSLFAKFWRETLVLYKAASTTEKSYDPAIKELWAGLLESRGLPFEVRAETSERRAGAASRAMVLRIAAMLANSSAVDSPTRERLPTHSQPRRWAFAGGRGRLQPPQAAPAAAASFHEASRAQRRRAARPSQDRTARRAGRTRL